jgi:hypothetical protein
MIGGKTLFLYDNWLAPLPGSVSSRFELTSNFTPTLSVSSQANGFVGGARKSGVGSATLEINAPAFSGLTNLYYTVEIDSVSGGTEVGQATFRWKDGSSPNWNATAVLTSSSFIMLNNNVQIKFTGGSGADFAVSDKWEWPAFAVYGPTNLYDGDRNTFFRTAVPGSSLSPEWIKIDLGITPSQGPNAVIVMDHNFGTTTNIYLEGNSVDDWTSPPFSLQLDYFSDDGHFVEFFSAPAYRYWRLKFWNTTSNFCEIGTVFLGRSLQLSSNPVFGITKSFRHIMEEQISRSRVPSRRVLGRQREINMTFQNLSDSDVKSLETLWIYSEDITGANVKPFFVTLFSQEIAPGSTVPGGYQTYMVYPSLDGFERSMDFYDINRVNLTLLEVVKSRV